MKVLALKVISRPDESDTTPLAAYFDASGGLIGRAETARLLLPDPKRMVSRFHAHVSYHDGAYYLEDMGSTNPASVNGQPLASGQKVPLKAGDRIRIGHYTIACDLEDASAVVATADASSRSHAIV
jgi:type VI secretion system FHA domain protein